MSYTCSCCGMLGHNKRTCPVASGASKPVDGISKAEKRAAKKLAALLPPPKAKKSPKVIEGLEGCQNIWKVPASYYKAKKGTTKCSVCGEFGHNSRFHKSLKCSPCIPTLNIGVSNEDPFGVLEEIKKEPFTGAPGTGFDGGATPPFPRRSSRIASMAY